MIVLDTSILVDALTGRKRSASALRDLIDEGHQAVLPSLVLFEWLRGPRLPDELIVQEALFPSSAAIPFGSAEAALSAKLYGLVSRPRGREVDLGIAACSLLRQAELWTLNRADFSDIRGLRLR